MAWGLGPLPLESSRQVVFPVCVLIFAYVCVLGDGL